jgi:hypothetical protein
MTPKEKAEQLIFYYQNLLEPYLKNINSLRNKSIQCALIAVDEIIASNPIAFDEEDNCIAKQWWQEVKTEIEKL